MKAHLKTSDGRLTFEVEADKPTELFAAVASLQEVFEAEKTCGCCNAPSPRFVMRIAGEKKYKYYELHCVNQECRARFSFGQSQEIIGNLFPKRKSEDGAWLPNRGWEIYRKEGSAPAQGRQAAPPPSRATNPGPPPFPPDQDRW